MSYKQSNTIRKKWHQTLTSLVQQAEQIAQSSQRQRKMSVEQFVQTMVLGCLDPEAVSLRLWCEVTSELGCQITGSSIDERMTERTVMLLYLVLQLSIQQQIDVSVLPVEHLHPLSHLILYDSTEILLPPILQWAFQAKQDSGHGQMKLQVSYDYLTGQLNGLSIHEGIEPDQTHPSLLAQAVENALLVFDLGYFSQHTLASINDRGAFYVTRYQSQTGLYDLQSKQAIDLVDRLKQTEGDWFEMTCLLGAKAKTPVRLVARRVCQSKADERRRQTKRRAQQEKYTATQRSLILCDWEILVSNLCTSWTAQQIMDVYRVRWQIELLFKAWKSYLDIAKFGYWRAERILCQVYASLIGAVLCQSTFACARYTTSETSLFKSVRLIRRRIAHLLRVIRHHWWGLLAWAKELRQALLNFAQQQNLETAPSSLRRLTNWGLT